MRQAFTFSTPYEIGRAVEGFAKGESDAQPLTEFAQPFYSELLARTTGYDPFKGIPVERGLIPLAEGLARQVTVDSPGAQNVRNAMRSEEERQQAAEAGRLYPRNRLDDILRIGLGLLAPTPINPETARKYARAGAESAEEKLKAWVAETTQARGEAPDPYYIEVKANKLRYTEVLAEMRKEKRTRDLSDHDLVEARMRVYFEAHPQERVNEAQWLAWLADTPDSKLSKWRAWLNKYERRVRFS